MPTHAYRVNRTVKISHNSIRTGDGTVMDSDASFPFEQFAEEAYRYFGINYPKFHKMDRLSRLGFLAAELLLHDSDWKSHCASDRMGVVLSNKNSSLDTDLKYAEMLKNGVASPAVFVYSLPNIVIGEICIRNGIKGENTFFISDRYEIPAQVSYVNSLLEAGTIDACICGWVELVGETYEAFLYLVSKTGADADPHTTANIEQHYKN